VTFHTNTLTSHMDSFFDLEAGCCDMDADSPQLGKHSNPNGQSLPQNIDPKNEADKRPRKQWGTPQ